MRPVKRLSHERKTASEAADAAGSARAGNSNVQEVPREYEQSIKQLASTPLAEALSGLGGAVISASFFCMSF